VEVTTLGDEVRASMWAERVTAYLVSAFAVLAAVVSGAGLYAVMAFAVVQRRRELGIRAAVGARPVDVFRLLFGEGSVTAAGGLFLGLVCALVAAPLLQGFLFGLEARSAGVYLAVSVVVAGLAGLAILAPAMRGARVDPAVALRRE
jgi:putative ABC transport system permease protein